MDNLTMSKYLENFVSLKRMYLKEAKIMIIDKNDDCNYIYEKLFPTNNLNNIKSIGLENKIKDGVNFVDKELIEEKEEMFIDYINNEVNEISLILYCIPNFISDLSEKEKLLLEKLKEIDINLAIVIKNSEVLAMKDLINHYSYNLNDLKIKEFFVSSDIGINNRLINQWESLCSYIESILDSYYKDNFVLGQSINKGLRETYIYNNLKGLYEDILEAEDREDLNSYSILEINNLLNLAKENFIGYYGITDQELDSKQLELIKETVIENIVANIFTLETKKQSETSDNTDNEEEIVEVSNNISEDIEVAGEIIDELNIKITKDIGKDEVIKEFLSVTSSDQENKEEDRNDRTEIMDYDMDDLVNDRTEIMTYNVEQLNLTNEIQDDFEAFRNESIKNKATETERKSKKQEEYKDESGNMKKYSIVNMGENKTFKEITISNNYGINEYYDFEEEEFTTPLAEIEEVDDKQKSVIWNNESAVEDLGEFELIEKSTIKFKKFNMND